MSKENIEIYNKIINRIEQRVGTKICPFCNTQMKFRHSVIAQGPLSDTIIMKCPRCYYLASFGIPLSKEEFMLEKKERDGNWVSPYFKYGIIDPEHLIGEQLRNLGYIEYDIYSKKKGKDGK